MNICYYSNDLRHLDVFLVETPNILTEAFNVNSRKKSIPMQFYHT